MQRNVVVPRSPSTALATYASDTFWFFHSISILGLTRRWNLCTSKSNRFWRCELAAGIVSFFSPLAVALWQGGQGTTVGKKFLFVEKYKIWGWRSSFCGTLRAKLKFWAPISPPSEISSCLSESCNFLPPPYFFNPAAKFYAGFFFWRCKLGAGGAFRFHSLTFSFLFLSLPYLPVFHFFKYKLGSGEHCKRPSGRKRVVFSICYSRTCRLYQSFITRSADMSKEAQLSSHYYLHGVFFGVDSCWIKMSCTPRVKTCRSKPVVRYQEVRSWRGVGWVCMVSEASMTRAELSRWQRSVRCQERLRYTV